MSKIIQPKFDLEIIGMKFLGRGPKASGNGPGWSRSENIIYKCVECGSEMVASHNDYWNCECGAMHLDFDAGRFGSNFGDENILVYSKNGENENTEFKNKSSLIELIGKLFRKKIE
ncbi:hypothetical protein [Salegentibacter mishustinae]|uniref:hypothetical protein n=1 Tax=Salegentibacter mishustinae TaxID=270918 RepID=UPI00249118F3|nr:hypothetical protein [Salegentibacter mishustinae]